MTSPKFLCATFITVALAIGALIPFVGVVGAQSSTATILIRDACDPVTFNAVIGPGTCIAGAHGTIPFALFIEELKEDHIVGAWRFNPLLDASAGTFQLVTVNLSSGQQTTLQNKGGETHTFTKVATFGGGVVPPLNEFSLNPIQAPECLQPPSDTSIFVEAGETESGPTAGSTQLPEGVTNWQCCIHPWMRLRVAVNQGQQGQH